MLYDPKWEKTETKADPFSLENLIAWLEKQPADKPYLASEPEICLLGQFSTSMGATCATTKSIDLADAEPFGEIALRHPHTFGDALRRARAVASGSHD